ncbi:MAG: hypothetical protein Fur0035_12990 [Anaerolineales bacterium]
MKKQPRFAVLFLILLLLSALALARQDLFWNAEKVERAAQLSFDEQDFPAAIRLLSEARARGRLSPAGALLLGEAWWRAGERAQALTLWESFGSGGQASAGLFLRLAQAYQSQGQDSAAGRRLIRGAELFPDDAEMQFALALWQLSESPALARPALAAARRLDPAPAARYEIVAAALNEALAVDDLAYQRVVGGRALAALGNWPLAERAFTRAAQANPNYAEAWAWLGEARRQNHSELAWPAHLRALALAPADASVQARAGLFWQAQGNFARALEFFRRAAALEPENVTWRMALGEVNFLAGDLSQAYGEYRAVAALAPRNAEAWRALAVFCVATETDLRESGLPAALNAVSLAPQDWRNPDTLGRVLLTLGNNESARRMFLRAAELAPAEAAPLFHLGVLFFNTGDLAQARSYFEQAAALDPAGASGNAARRVLERYFPQP